MPEPRDRDSPYCAAVDFWSGGRSMADVQPMHRASQRMASKNKSGDRGAVERRQIREAVKRGPSTEERTLPAGKTACGLRASFAGERERITDVANKRCSIRVFSGHRWDMGGHPCAKPATMEHKGKRYCKLHYPPNVAAKRAAQTERWRQQGDQRQQLYYQIQAAERAVLAACEVWINSKESDQQSEDDLSSAIAAWRDLKQKRG